MGQQTTPIQARTVLTGETPPGDTGVLWRDSSTNPPTLRQHDGTEWVAVASTPISQTDAAETFGESDVTLSHTNSVVSGETLTLTNNSQQVGLQRGSSTTTGGSFTGDTSVEFVPAQNLTGVGYNFVGSAETSNISVTNVDTGTTIASKSVTGDWNSISADMVAGTTYRMTVTVQNDSVDNVETPSVPIELNAATITRWDNPHYEIRFNGLPYSGSTRVEWTAPTDIYSWDAATFNRTVPGDSTAEVYLEASGDGGSTWREIAGPITRGADIPASAGENVRVRVELSRTPNSDPEVNAVYRRYQV